MAAPEHLRVLPQPDDAIMANKSLRFYHDIPLSQGSFESRVLRLSPGTKNDPISASIEKMDLNNLVSPYNTLSYTWGDANVVKPITINGEIFQATINLYDALQHIRSADMPIMIWVDAVCINQWDLGEKSFQVSFMAELYKQCEKVYIWLGRPNHPNDLKRSPFALFEHFRDDKHYQDLPGYRCDVSTGIWTCDTKDPDFRALWDSFSFIAGCPWWTRTWTVQELILPPDAIVMFGDFSIHWNDITLSRVKRNAHIYTYTDECCGFSHEAIPSEDIQPFDTILGDVEELESARLGNGFFKTFQEIERAFASRKCQNPRDKIWSLLSFSPSDSIDYPVDYTKPVCEVFYNAFRNMLTESHGSLQCLFGHGFNSREHGLPSWARNFSDAYLNRDQNFLQNRRMFVVYPLFDACNGREGIARLAGVSGELHLKGVQVDRVSAVGKGCDGFWTSDLKALLDNWYELCLREDLSFTKDKLDDKFSRLLCGEVIDDPDTSLIWRLVRDTEPDLPTDAQWSSLMNNGDGWGLPRKYRGAVNTTISGRALYTTKAGRFGFSYPSIRPGDEVWVIDGSRVPFILRPEPGVSDRRLIGETYLHGIMHGEGIAEGTESANVVLV
ncbi:heterokaryon incompatibility protein-domain-containing protein [Annulohypoxylon bovei var. microspora]|nr:heterokaryon incompatibility protein-domain-containing protein [Annulohypoxylon bovei var. microspora]